MDLPHKEFMFIDQLKTISWGHLASWLRYTYKCNIPALLVHVIAISLPQNYLSVALTVKLRKKL